MLQRGLSAWGIQIGSFAAGRAPFVPKFLKLFHLHTGRPIPITPESQYWEKGIHPTPELDGRVGL